MRSRWIDCGVVWEVERVSGVGEGEGGGGACYIEDTTDGCKQGVGVDLW